MVRYRFLEEPAAFQKPVQKRVPFIFFIFVDRYSVMTRIHTDPEDRVIYDLCPIFLLQLDRPAATDESKPLIHR